MGMSYTKNAMEEIICYWIEAVHVTEKLEELSEYTNEAARVYEAAECIMKDAETQLKKAIKAAILGETGNFAKYKNLDYLENMEELTEMVYEQFDEINGSSRNEQIENFYRVLGNCMDSVLLKTA